MPNCPKCGKKTKSHEYCPHCGASIPPSLRDAAPKSGGIKPVHIAIVLGILFVIVIPIIILFFGGMGALIFLITQNVVNTTNIVRCGDGTYAGNCSSYVGFLCAENGSYVFNCSSCGCTAGLSCYEERCWTEEQKTGMMIQNIQQGVVYVAHSYATGSGVIISQNETHTTILTNLHVIKDAKSVSDVKITTRDGQTIPAEDIRVAPFDMDLATVSVLGVYGTPVRFSNSSYIYQGEAVMALGSPLGIKGSVSNGIISNFMSHRTNGSWYNYDVIQTDAAINPGNSGGGLFLKNNGELIGINTFILASAYGSEGLGFAIDSRSIKKLPPMSNWKKFTPAQKCSDGTAYGSCSVSSVGYLCSNGNLIASCKTCGCGSTGYCASNQQCYSCKSGYNIYEDSTGHVFCCPSGTRGYQGGYCR